MEIARHWRLNNQRYKLQGSVCTCCGKTFFAPRAVCNECSQSEAPLYSFDEKSLRRQIVDSAYASGK